ncbi:hypothetical protein LEP1GSC036_4137 [Leptospira weilii str. 2006001853]|uniref:Uncharacterized protein n=3 Tax=Leptospira weilii TaxID=28184 RepID=A0A828Z5G6_9LEPT|nr:hypothetical protein LEP1GSC036_4137 [Leptospira weilii str. 2006001853]EMJ59739.1 hypothetical protein LEP1GSC051_4182 [Leptospira sp. P2653]EMM72072.1 hypothetical protein LEP1GSC038_3688 [Leptospira weilii str. 2006001855]EMN46319.1 hypothetical protein LEP1GSC086_3369 [Leptospira weilii str. LNT 1234]EMN90038.1 hypothetical protein LEP1GSC108_4786 [Leptospira weilii str. UI 13098]
MLKIEVQKKHIRKKRKMSFEFIEKDTTINVHKNQPKSYSNPNKKYF